MQRYWISPLPKSPAGEQPYVTAVNSVGQVVGGAGDTALFWDTDLSVTVLPFVGDRCTAQGVNNSGSVVGTVHRSYRRSAVVVHQGQKIDVSSWLQPYPLPFQPPPPPVLTEGTGINDNNVICGAIGWDGQRRPFLFDFVNYLFTKVETLPPGHIEATPVALNNLGHMVGYSLTSNDARAFLWRDDQFFDLGPDVVLEDINDADIVVGRRRTATGWACCHADASGAPPLSFKDLPVHADSATAVNDHGEIIGGGIAGAIPVDVFIQFPAGHPEAGTKLFKDRVLNIANWTLQEASDISDTGIVVGKALTGGGTAFILYPIDLP